MDWQGEFHDFADEDPEFHPDRWFVFAIHQGYQFYYFRDGDPASTSTLRRKNSFHTWDPSPPASSPPWKMKSHWSTAGAPGSPSVRIQTLPGTVSTVK